MVLRIASARVLAAGAASRTAVATTPIQARACSMCRSVKDWKENHGAWSRKPQYKAVAETSRTAAINALPGQQRAYASSGGKSLADAKIDEITEAFNTAKDELELATEETEKKTVYAEADREAANEELERVLQLFNDAVQNSPQEVGDEVRSRIGARIRELEHGFKRLEEMAMED